MDKRNMIDRIAAKHGFEQIGVCAYDEQRRPLLPCRAASRLPQGAQSVIVCVFPYAFEADDPTKKISRYACVKDYHTAAGEVLSAFCETLRTAFPCERFEPFIDNSPLREVACAVAAGLGVKGDNGLFISDVFGSFVFIGCVVTTLSLPAEEEYRECLHCGACTVCCHGGCLPSPERDTCVSALTQKKGELTPQETALIVKSGSMWGCDACQECCPMNVGKRIAPHSCFGWYRPEMTVDDLDGKAYAWRGKAVLVRNTALFETTE